MSITDLSLVKSHLRVDSGTDEDTLLSAYLDAAEDAAIQYLNRNVYATENEVDAAIENGEDRPLLANAAFTAAVLYMVAEMYAKREDGAGDKPHLTRESIRFLDPYRIGWGV